MQFPNYPAPTQYPWTPDQLKKITVGSKLLAPTFSQGGGVVHTDAANGILVTVDGFLEHQQSKQLVLRVKYTFEGRSWTGYIRAEFIHLWSKPYGV